MNSILLWANEIDENLLSQCSSLFSSHYGIWQHNEKQITLSPRLLKKDYLDSVNSGVVILYPDSNVSKIVEIEKFGAQVTGDISQVTGHAFFKHFMYKDKKVCWITQLVVHPDYRSRGYAKLLLQKACYGTNLIGIASTHPHAIMAARFCKKGTVLIDSINQVQDIVRGSDIKYIKDCECKNENGYFMINTKFFVKHPFETSHVIDGSKETSHVIDGTKEGSHVIDGSKETSHVIDGSKETSQIGTKEGSHVIDGSKETSQIGTKEGSYLPNGHEFIVVLCHH